MQKLIAIDLSKQQKLDGDRKIIAQVNYRTVHYRLIIEELLRIIIEEVKTILDFSQGTVRGLWIYFPLI